VAAAPLRELAAAGLARVARWADGAAQRLARRAVPGVPVGPGTPGVPGHWARLWQQAGGTPVAVGYRAPAGTGREPGGTGRRGGDRGRSAAGRLDLAPLMRVPAPVPVAAARGGDAPGVGAAADRGRSAGVPAHRPTVRNRPAVVAVPEPAGVREAGTGAAPVGTAATGAAPVLAGPAGGAGSVRGRVTVLSRVDSPQAAVDGPQATVAPAGSVRTGGRPVAAQPWAPPVRSGVAGASGVAGRPDQSRDGGARQRPRPVAGERIPAAAGSAGAPGALTVAGRAVPVGQPSGRTAPVPPVPSHVDGSWPELPADPPQWTAVAPWPGSDPDRLDAEQRGVPWSA